MTRTSNRLALVAILAANLCGCGKTPPDPAKGNDAFFRGDFAAAIREYGKEFGHLPEDENVAARMALAYFVNGEYSDFLRLYNQYIQVSGVHEDSDVSAGTVHLLTHEDGGDLAPELVRGPFLLPPQTAPDLPHLIKSRLLKSIANRVTEGGKTDEAKALAILDFVTRNVKSDPDEVEGDPSADPIGILMRGFGVCDRSAWAFIALARQVGIPAHLFYLRDPDDEKLKSPHSLATVLLGGKFVLFDTYGGFALRDPEGGQLLTLEDVLSKPATVESIVDDNPGYPLDAKYFKKSLYLVTLTPAAIIPRMKVLEDVLRKQLPNWPDLPAIAQVAKEEVLGLVKGAGAEEDKEMAKGKYRFPFTFPGREYQAEIWLYPFHLAREAPPGFEFYRALPKVQRDSRSFRDARLQQLLGKFEPAITAYESLASDGGDLAEPSQFYAAVCRYESRELEKAIKGFKDYLEKFPDGQWKNLAHLHLGLTYREQGELAAAKASLAEVAGPRLPAARMAITALENAPEPEEGEKGAEEEAE